MATKDPTTLREFINNLEKLSKDGKYDNIRVVIMDYDDECFDIGKERIQPQQQWKPSEKQMNALNDVISSRDIKYDVLSELWKDLKQL